MMLMLKGKNLYMREKIEIESQFPFSVRVVCVVSGAVLSSVLSHCNAIGSVTWLWWCILPSARRSLHATL